MNDISERAHALQVALAEFLPGLPLRWYDLAGGLRGFFLEQEPALRPLPAERVGQVMDSPPFWSLLWPSGEAVCRLLMGTAELVRGRQVLDFGAGCGLLACAAARAGARQCYAVDSDPLAREAARLHALANRVPLEVLSSWDWRPVELLLAADFLYDSTHLSLFERLAERAEETLVVDSRLERLSVEGFRFLGEAHGTAVPDLEKNSPSREFGRLRFWYRGARPELWAASMANLSCCVSSSAVLDSLSQRPWPNR